MPKNEAMVIVCCMKKARREAGFSLLYDVNLFFF